MTRWRCSGKLTLCNVPTEGPSYTGIGPVNSADHNDAAVKMLQPAVGKKHNSTRRSGKSAESWFADNLFLLDGTVSSCIRPIIFTGRFLALRKCGGLSPIAIDCTLRRLAAKIANIQTCERLANSFSPHQRCRCLKWDGGCRVHSGFFVQHNLSSKCFRQNGLHKCI
ncbi:hypothetical protein GJ496_003452 [Pomphorhynchus laevis]|nr:hypothetical protein GJ496_003452 [Pomphorhynchus laevis]